ncbi:MAG: hypothetical protein IIA58_01545 [Candidatus Marinimicrobia bacterium]|nr:hypothetical protein [Candidatus Neomarinimicrobiota bacterium]
MNNSELRGGFNLNSVFLLIGIISVIFTAGINYGGISGYKEEVENIKKDYARKDVLDVRLKNIEESLIEIKEALKRREQE